MRKDSSLELDRDSNVPRVELAARESAGASVTLLWAPATNVVAVVVVDPARSESFELVVDAPDDALDVFYHPYAVAAARRIDLADSRDESESDLDGYLSKTGEVGPAGPRE